jgi:hypothetical protein
LSLNFLPVLQLSLFILDLEKPVFDEEHASLVAIMKFFNLKLLNKKPPDNTLTYQYQPLPSSNSIRILDTVTATAFLVRPLLEGIQNSSSSDGLRFWHHFWHLFGPISHCEPTPLPPRLLNWPDSPVADC